MPADNRVFPDRLTTDQRTMLRTAMRTVHAIQEVTAQRFATYTVT